MELKELNGWIWAKRKIDKDEGWLPNEILKEITQKEYTCYDRQGIKQSSI